MDYGSAKSTQPFLPKMPQYSINVGATLFGTTSELPIAFCLTGKRREDFERPDEAIMKASADLRLVATLTQEALMEARKYRWEVAHGKYAVKALAWLEGEDQAESTKARFDSAEWDVESMKLVPVTVMP